MVKKNSLWEVLRLESLKEYSITIYNSVMQSEYIYIYIYLSLQTSVYEIYCDVPNSA